MAKPLKQNKTSKVRLNDNFDLDYGYKKLKVKNIYLNKESEFYYIDGCQEH